MSGKETNEDALAFAGSEADEPGPMPLVPEGLDPDATLPPTHRPSGPDSVTMVPTDPASAWDRYRRHLRQQRANLSRPIVIRADDDTRRGTVHNLSMRGVFIRMDDPYAVDTRVSFDLELVSNVPVEIRGTVRWNRRETMSDAMPVGIGVVFDPLSREEVMELERFLRQR